LPKCLQAVAWQNNNSAHDVVDMLRLWKPLEKEDALGLLDCGFADSTTRSHAVKLLRVALDNDTDTLLMYLLQLVQVLKYELYLDCDLARWLLERALTEQRVGHFFFWYLRSEMHLPDAKVRNALLLEAYLKGCGNHMSELKLQVVAMTKLVEIANSIKPNNIKKDKKKVEVQKQLDAVQKTDGLGQFQLPYAPSLRLAEVSCPRVMDSKKLPLWLTFKNAAGSPHKDHNLIFKAGDDLRQDMLTLQLIRLMDQLWLEQGLDFKMNAYECLSTGDEIGALEVVMNAKTIAGIQGSVRAVRQDDPLYKWLKEENPGEGPLMRATDNFLLSCVGYSVATYVLGIGDRHNDNIMCTRDGKLFHIDFGHFLGNWKSKFGIKRERVKFILTPDFVYAMSNGSGAKSPEYKRYKELCRRAYLVVRKKANLFINLLNMMLSTGIPELQSKDDVAYLQSTLCLDVSDEEAGELFMGEIDQALKDSWSVRVNWAAHIAAH
jgi:phosphatidylinositol-4,5-bisphosphate 3-kinase